MSMCMVTLYDFYADWCGPCKQQDPILDELADDYADEDEFEIEKIDADEDRETANEYQVRSLPTLVLVDDDGDVLDRFVGLTDKDELDDAVDNAL